MSSQSPLPLDDDQDGPRAGHPRLSSGRTDIDAVAVTVRLGADDVERIAQRAAEILAARTQTPRRGSMSPYLTIPEAAELLRTKR